MSVTHFGLDEGQRQLTLRALAVQGLRSPGFKMASREAAEALHGGAMFDEFCHLLQDVEPPRVGG